MSSSKKPLSLFLTRMTPAIWTQFYSWYETRKEDHRPIVPNHGVWVVTDNIIEVPNCGSSPELVAGCCMYPCDGPYCVVEFVSTNPALPVRVVHAAVERICAMVASYGALTGKTMLCFPKHKGVKRLMEKSGYNPVKPEVEIKWGPLYVGVGAYDAGHQRVAAAVAPATLEAANAAE